MSARWCYWQRRSSSSETGMCCLAHLAEGLVPDCPYRTAEEQAAAEYQCDYKPVEVAEAVARYKRIRDRFDQMTDEEFDSLIDADPHERWKMETDADLAMFNALAPLLEEVSQ